MLRDPQLLLSYRQGSKTAYLALYNKYANPLRCFLQGGFSFSSQGKLCRFRGVGSTMDGDAIIQETFTRAFAKTTRENYDGVRPFQTYLFSIAKNLVLRECHYRDRVVSVDQIEETENGNSLFGSSAFLGENPEKNAANKQLEIIMQAFIDTLSVEEKSFFSFRFAKGHTQESTADKMGTTRARIKLLEKNIRRRFLEKLRENGYFTNYAPNPRWKRQQEALRLANG